MTLIVHGLLYVIGFVLLFVLFLRFIMAMSGKYIPKDQRRPPHVRKPPSSRIP